MGDMVPARARDGARPCRIRFAEVSCHVRRGWCLVLNASQRLIAARRDSFSQDPTGAALWSRLRKRVADVYGKSDRTNTYAPCVPELVKESEEGAPQVKMGAALLAEVANVFVYESNVVRALSAEETTVLKDLCSKHDQLGGPRTEWAEYHGRSDVRRLWA